MIDIGSLPEGITPSTSKQTEEAEDEKSNNIAFGPQNISQLTPDERYLYEWKAADDVTLITAGYHICDIDYIHKNTKFNKDFSLDNIGIRWTRLMCDPTFAQLAKQRISRTLTGAQILKLQANIPFSPTEYEILCSISTAPYPNWCSMQKILDAKKNQFHSARNAHVLLDEWHRLRVAQKLTNDSSKNESLDPSGMGKRGTRFVGSSFKMDKDIFRPKESEEDMSPHSSPKQTQKSYRKLLLNDFMDSAEYADHMASQYEETDTVQQLESDSTLIARLVGKMVVFSIRKDRPAVIGRSTPTHKVDIDLSLEAPSDKVAREQAILTQDKTGMMWIENLGRRPIYVHGATLHQGQKMRLEDMTPISIAEIELVFNYVNNRSAIGISS